MHCKLLFCVFGFYCDLNLARQYFRELLGMEVTAAAEGGLDAVAEALPELTSELLSAQTSQFSEIEQQEERLEKLGAELVSLQEQLVAETGNVDALVRNICLKEDLLAELAKQCRELEEGVIALVLEREQLALSKQNAIQREQTEDKVRRSYQEKMDLHRAKVKELEQLSSTQVQLEAVKKKIGLLKAKSKYFSLVESPNTS